MVREALAAHHVFAVDPRRPVEIAAAEETQLLRWLSNRLGRPLRPPELAPLGYRLIGGRLLPGGSGARAQPLIDCRAKFDPVGDAGGVVRESGIVGHLGFPYLSSYRGR